MMSGPIPEPRGETISDDRLLALLSTWSTDGHGGLARRLAQALRAAITGGVLPGGTALPPERHLAALLSVSRSTVTTALDELRAAGLIRSHQGRGTEVVGPAGPAPTGHRVGTHFVHRTHGIDLAAVVPTDGSHLPELSLRTEDLVAATGLLEPLGATPLREALAHDHRSRGLPTTAEQIQVTHGAHHAIDLVIDACTGPGDAVALEDPSYPGVLDVLDHRRLRAIALHGDAAGPDPEHLRQVLARDRPALLYLQTGVQNPTGTVIAPARRRALAEILDHHGSTLVIEDNTLADLAFSGRPEPSFAALCHHAPVVSVGSLSKVAWAGLRIGWLRATGPTADRLQRVRATTDLGASVPAQLLALQLLPHLPTLAERRRADLQVAVDAAMAQLSAELPTWRVHPPAGSSALWPELPLPDASAFVALARRHGVHVTPGSVHVVEARPEPHLRLCVDRPPAQVEAGIERLASAWHDAIRRGPRSLA